MANVRQVIEVQYESSIRVGVYTFGDVNVHSHMATGYRILDGYLLVLKDTAIIATYNVEQWISIRE